MSAPLEAPTELRDAAEIEAFLRRDLDLHLYELGDLDPFFWPRTRWVGARRGAELAALALDYSDPAGHHTLLLMERRDPEAARHIVQSGRELLPERFYAHVSPPSSRTPRASTGATSK